MTNFVKRDGMIAVATASHPVRCIIVGPDNDAVPVRKV
jgi:hypothetical protein